MNNKIGVKLSRPLKFARNINWVEGCILSHIVLGRWFQNYKLKIAI